MRHMRVLLEREPKLEAGPSASVPGRQPGVRPCLTLWRGSAGPKDVPSGAGRSEDGGGKAAARRGWRDSWFLTLICPHRFNRITPNTPHLPPIDLVGSLLTHLIFPIYFIGKTLTHLLSLHRLTVIG
ncbi:hypothetical protein FKM82_027979 [Ascaphus truei]